MVVNVSEKYMHWHFSNNIRGKSNTVLNIKRLGFFTLRIPLFGTRPFWISYIVKKINNNLALPT